MLAGEAVDAILVDVTPHLLTIAAIMDSPVGPIPGMFSTSRASTSHPAENPQRRNGHREKSRGRLPIAGRPGHLDGSRQVLWKGHSSLQNKANKPSTPLWI